MARLTKEQRRELANIRDEGESDIVAAIRDLAACILRLDEEVASEDGQCTGHEATISRLSDDLRDERAARANLFSALSRVEASRDEARTMLGQLQSAFSAAVNVVIKTGHHRTTPVLAEAVSLIVAERDEAKADLDALARAVAQALMVPTLDDREELVDPIDHAIVGAMLGMRNARDTALARLAKVEAERDEARSTLDAMSVSLRDRLAEAERERDGARAKLADVDRLLAIEEQAKRVARAERWHEWACLAHLDAHLSARTRTEDLRDALIALNEASDALDAECHKLAEMVGEGES